MKLELNITEKDKTILDEAYGGAGLVEYLNNELASKLGDYIRASKFEDIVVDDAMKDEIVAKIEAENAAEILAKEEIIV